MPRVVLGLAAMAAVAAVAGCRLDEVAAPASADVLVVEAVLRAGSPWQFVLLHRSVEGRHVRGEPGALVKVMDERGRSIVYRPTPLELCVLGSRQQWEAEGINLGASCYTSGLEDAYFVEPGLRYRLEVTTAGGAQAMGQTTVPGAFAYTSPRAPLRSPSLVADCRLPSTPFTLAWRRSEGAWAYVVSMQLQGFGDELRQQGVSVPDPLELTSVSVSAADTTLLFPANVGLFQRGEYDRRVFETLRGGLPPGTRATLVVLATDRNYTNAIRGGRFHPSGNVRLSSVVGDAVGLFGSTVPLIIRSAPDNPVACPDPLPPTAGAP
ncbi:MAG TPA: DUF4249 family protein [Longimicrobiaceae bacterium]|nr:DUF4249 family protein [Longimicrobiaceae bacterium]